MNDSDKVTVREYIEALLENCKEVCKDKFNSIDVKIQDKFKELDEKMGAAFRFEKQSLETAKTELDRRLEGMNEFRAQLEKQADSFVNEGEQILFNTLIREKTENLEKRGESWITNKDIENLKFQLNGLNSRVTSNEQWISDKKKISSAIAVGIISLIVFILLALIGWGLYLYDIHGRSGEPSMSYEQVIKKGGK